MRGAHSRLPLLDGRIKRRLASEQDNSTDGRIVCAMELRADGHVCREWFGQEVDILNSSHGHKARP